jgi:uncharacterized protein (DUF2384 family)
MIRLRSVDSPFRSRELCHHAVSAMMRAEAMGLLPREEVIEVVDRKTMTRVLNHIFQAGIARGLAAGLAEPAQLDGDRLGTLLAQLNDALEESPAPAYEWPHLAETFGVDELARLLGISASSVRRYKENARATPDDIAVRLHFLALVVGDLAGAYNDIGIRRWFDRPRTPLGNRTPQQLLRGEWSPTDTGPAKVRELARSLVAATAT